MFDWQSIAAALVILAACAYVARRAWARLRSFRAAGGGASCETGCGKCGDDELDALPKTATPKPLVQIGRAKQTRRRMN
ncbi:MAG TPA: hypothetical protein VGV38_18955 [Pyrinomonadaceae bacterium]|nr:hypothetical protein [Pyrinomonadaceae bacterium]